MLASACQHFKSNEKQSGGADAEKNENGQCVNAIHPFEFMGGRLATMLWEDGIRLVAGGDDTNFTCDVVIPDEQPGAGSSVPGGGGVRGTVGASGSYKPATSAKSKRSKTPPNDQARLYNQTQDLISILTKSAQQEVKGNEPALGDLQKARERDRAQEDLLDDVGRLQQKVNTAPSEYLRTRFQKLLDGALLRVEEAEKELQGAAAASAAASAAVSLSSPLAAASCTPTAGGEGPGAADRRGGGAFRGTTAGGGAGLSGYEQRPFSGRRGPGCGRSARRGGFPWSNCGKWRRH